MTASMHMSFYRNVRPERKTAELRTEEVCWHHYIRGADHDPGALLPKGWEHITSSVTCYFVGGPLGAEYIKEAMQGYATEPPYPSSDPNIGWDGETRDNFIVWRKKYLNNI